jgi:hypothetical protein
MCSGNLLSYFSKSPPLGCEFVANIKILKTTNEVPMPSRKLLPNS